MEAFLVITVCVILTFWPAVAAQVWARWAIATKHYGHTDHAPDWLFVAVFVGIVISILLMPLEISAFDPRRSYLSVIVFVLAVLINAGSEQNAKERVIRARNQHWATSPLHLAVK